MKVLSAQVLRFKRSKEHGWEYGIATSRHVPGVADLDVIVDLEGQVVKDIWGYRITPYQGCFTFYVETVI